MIGGRRLASAAAVALAAAAVLTGCGSGSSDSGGSSSGPGDSATRIDGISGMKGSAVDVQLPNGRLRVTLAKPTSDVPAGQAGDGRRHTAPDGRVFLGIDATFQPLAGIPSWQHALLSSDMTDASLAFRVGGKAYAIGRTGSLGEPVYLLVPKGGDPELEVDWHGVTQRVDVGTGKLDPGDAALLYDPSPAADQPASHDCAGGDWGKPDLRVTGMTCRYWSARMPYLPDLGWRREGWAIVAISTSAASVRIGGQDYPVTAMKDDSRLGGARPAATLLPKATSLPTSELTLERLLAFAPGSRSLRIVRTLTLDDDHGQEPPSRTVTISKNVTL